MGVARESEGVAPTVRLAHHGGDETTERGTMVGNKSIRGFDGTYGISGLAGGGEPKNKRSIRETKHGGTDKSLLR